MSDILDYIRKGLELQIKDAIERDDIPQDYIQQVTQSYLLLQILDKLNSIESGFRILRILDVSKGAIVRDEQE